MKVKKIVCPTDFSPASYAAVEAAGDVAKQFGAELVLVHVVMPMPVAPDMEAFGSFDIMAYESGLKERMMQSLADEAEKRLPSGVSRTLEVRQGDPATQIVELVEEAGADWIVIATHGMTGWRHYMFGSVAQKVIQHARCPVLTVRAPAEAAAE